MNGGYRSNSRNQRFASANSGEPAFSGTGSNPCSLPQNEQSLIREFMQALAEEIEAIKKGRGGSIVTVYDGSFVRREGPFFVYIFTTESPLVVMDDAPAEVEVGGERFAGQIISVQGSEVAVGIEHDFGKSITEARLITNLWYLLEALRKRYEEVLNGQRSLDTRLGQRLLGFSSAATCADAGDLHLPPSPCVLNDEQVAAIRAACGSDVHFIWGPPGTGKTQTIGFLIAALMRRNLRVLVVSHTNVATDHAIGSAAELLLDTEDYQSGKLVRYGNISPNSQLPEMVIPEKIAERLGQHLKDRLAGIQSELGKVESQIKTLREIESLLAAERERLRQLGELEANLRRCATENDAANSKTKTLGKELQEAKDKLTEARAPGALRRLFFGVNPAKAQATVNRLERELAILHQAIVAGASKSEAIQSAINRLKSSQDTRFNNVQATLTKRQLDEAGISASISQLSKQVDELTVAIRAIEAELEALLAKILREAKVIATSLTKATISKQMDDQKFDVVVVDEASMAPMPSLYFAAGRSAQKAIVVGDFRQLPPIVLADTEMAQKWLGRDIFNQAGVQRAVDERKPEPRLTMLRRQYRMHPEISRVSNNIIYGGQLVDSLSRDTLREIDTFLENSPFATTPLVLYDVSSTNPWSSRLDQGGRYNLYSAVLSAELARRAARAGIESVGIISPYSVHARLIKMMLDDSGDATLRHLKVSTVHRFQGLEQEAIIFDIAEGPMPRYGPSGLVDGVDLASQAAKLINVSITRPKAQIAIVANVDYLASRLRPDSILMRVLDEIRQRGTVIDSQEVLNDYFCDEFERWAGLLDPHDDEIDPNDSTLYTERNFYAAFFADLRKGIREIVIVSPFLTASRAQQFLNLFRSKVAEGIEVRVFTRTLREQQGDMLKQAEMVFGELKRIGVQVVERRGLHQKFAFIDREVAWEGSLNILSQSEGRSTEHMRRLPFPKTCEELIELHKLGSDSEVDPGSRRPVQSDLKCEKCGSPKVLVRGPHTIFLGCMDYPQCRCEPQFIRRGERILTDAICPGKDDVACGKPMVATLGRFGVYLRCSDQSCKGTRNIKS
jgi:hypothetical protein